MSAKDKVVIVSAVRTPIGKFGGALADTKATRLGAIVITEAIRKAGLEPKDVEEVFMGCVLQAGLGQNPARQAAMGALIPQEVPALTVNVVCGSGLRSVQLGAQAILSGERDVVVAGGMESMSLAPYLLEKARFGYRMNDGRVRDSMVLDALWDVYGDYHMGITAENIAERFGITRQAQDAFAALSQQKCEAARKAGRFSDEIVPITVKTRKGEVVIDADEFPRDGVTAESLSKLRPAFRPDGTVTAGNASGVNDGAAAVVLMRASKAEELGVEPLAEYLGGTSIGVDPAYMGLGAAEAAKRIMRICGETPASLGLIEANEAFASQSIACARIGGWDSADLMQKVNVNGGALALGHPVGASGCRILVTLVCELRRRGGGSGLATLCVGGGMGVASIIRA